MINFTDSDFRYLKSIIKEAGKIALSYQSKGLKISRKIDSSIITQVDLIVQNFLINKISKRFKEIVFIYEENFDILNVEVEADKLYAIIDPIDGSAMFSMGLPIWCISVGFFFGTNPIFGFVYSPSSNMFFYNDDSYSYINNRKVKVLDDVVIDSETNFFFATEIQKEFVIQFPGKARNLGSTALQACLTIDNVKNRSIAFIGKSYFWDWAGAIPIILKAGGFLRYFSGEEIDYSKLFSNGFKIKDYLISYNAVEFKKIQEFLVKI